MIHYSIQQDGDDATLLTNLHGKALLSIAQLNKGTAFSKQERELFGLIGKLPARIETLDEQVDRAYQQYCNYQKLENKNTYLNHLLDTNQTLFYKLVSQHLQEMLPTLYTPIVGTTVTHYHQRFMTPRGLYIAHTDQDQIETILDNRTNSEIKLIVVSDGESVLGIGDQGVGAMAIPVAKLMVYTLCGSINPNHTLPILLDAGTNNPTLLQDPLYLGLRENRINGEKYHQFIEKFISAIRAKFPNVFLHWEDFGAQNAHYNLKAYKNQLCSFNDDIQGTGIVALAAVLSAGKITNTPLKKQRFVVYGGGAAGIGVSQAIYQALIEQGISPTDAKQQFWIIDRFGLITNLCTQTTDAQQFFAKSHTDVSEWTIDDPEHITLQEVIDHVAPTVLIGTSAQAAAFNETIIRTLTQQTERPVVLPLSNPTRCAEATPTDIINWSNNQALIATGSPFDPVCYQGQQISIAQCNNFQAFPGLGLGVTSAKAKQISTGMLLAASEALAEYAVKNGGKLLPDIGQCKAAAKHIAQCVAAKAIEEGHSDLPPTTDIHCLIEKNLWDPHYIKYRKI